MTKRRLILIGGGGHCKSCIDVIQMEGKYEIAGILDVEDKVGSILYGYPIIGSDKDLPELVDSQTSFLITIGQIKSAAARLKIYTQLQQLKGELAVIISPLSIVSPSAFIGGGTIVLHGAKVNADAIVGKNCIINTNANIEHEALVADHVHISTGAVVNGNGVVKTGSFVGSGAVIVNNVEIGEEVVIGAGSVVFRDITAPGIYAGNPCKKISE